MTRTDRPVRAMARPAMLPAAALIALVGASPATAADARAPFEISGTVDTQLQPGAGGSLDLALRNPHDTMLRLTALTVRVNEVSTMSTLGCSLDDFVVEQYAPSSAVVLPADSTRTLSALGLTTSELPNLRMQDTATNQDGCKSAILTLAYTGTAVGDSGDAATPGGVDPADLPATGADGPPPWAIALVGLGLLGAGAASVYVTRRRNTTPSTASHARRTN